MREVSFTLHSVKIVLYDPLQAKQKAALLSPSESNEGFHGLA